MCKSLRWICQIVVTMLFVTTVKAQYLTPRYEVKIENDIKYAEAEGYWTSIPDEGKSFVQMYLGQIDQLMSERTLDLTMDIYHPNTASTQLRPLIVFLHGGSFFNGDKSDKALRQWCLHFASLGYVAVSMNYRLGWVPNRTSIDVAGFRAIQDAHAALRFLIHNADIYHINPDWIFVGGTSAGGITALHTAFLNDDNKPASVVNEGPINKLAPEYSENFHIATVINMWGAICDTTILRDSRTSILCFHGDADPIIPYGYGYPFVRMLEKKDKSVSEGFIESIMPYVIPSPDDEIWENLIPPMYGSSCIVKYCKDHGIRSELHTGQGMGHSMHTDKNHQLNSYFYTIQDSITLFLNDEIIKRPIH